MINTEKRSICIISQYFLPDLNGDVIRLLNALRALKDLGCKVTIVTAFPHYPNGQIPSNYKNKVFTKELWNGVDVIRTFILPLPHNGFINRLLLYLSFSTSSLVSLFLIGKVDVVWAFSQRFFSYFSGLTFKLIRKARLILDLTDVWPEAIVNTGYMNNRGPIFRLANLLLVLLFKLSDLVITLTNPMKDMIVSKGIDQRKVAVLPNIVDLRAAKPMNVDKEGFSRRFVVMYSGNFGPNYDFKTLLEAASMINDQNDDILFVMRGRGEMRDYIVNYVKEKSLNNVYLDERILSKGDLVKYLNRADVFVLPLRKCLYPDASFSIKLLDYLASGRPVICCADGYLSKLISEHNAGISVPPESPDELKRAVIILEGDSKLRKEMSRNARILAERLFFYSALKKGIADFFEI